MQTKTDINIAIAFDENYANLALVLLTSIFSNNKEKSFNIHVIANNVSNHKKTEIESFVHHHHSRVHYYDDSQIDFKRLPIHKDSHLSVTTYCRLFFASVIPTHVKKLIYLDVDIVVIGALQELYDIDMGERAVGAVLDYGTKTYPLLGIHEKYKYFNAGVLLINVEEWKKQQVTERVLEFIYQNPEKLRLGDQDAMNAVLLDCWYQLPSKYNVTTLDIPKQLSRLKYQSFITDKVIIHYTMGKHKPWRFLNKNKLRFLYYHYLKLSPVKNKEKYSDFSMKPSVLYRFLKIRVEERLVDHPKFYKIAKKAKFI